MEYKLPPLPKSTGYRKWDEESRMYCTEEDGRFSYDQMRQYAEQAVAPLLAEIERLEGMKMDGTERG